MGNFPVRMLVILVKLCKLIEYKKQLIANLTTMNNYAEQMTMYDNKYSDEFRVRPAHYAVLCHTFLRNRCCFCS